MPRPTIIGLGELLWDDFPHARLPGGAPANVAYQANQLGAQGLPASRVGTDADGDELLRYLTQQGIDTRLIQRDEAHPTGRVTVVLTDGNQPQYTIHQQVAWEFLAPVSELIEAAGSASAICFGTLAQRTETTRQTIHHCLQAASEKTLIVYDVNLRQKWYNREWIERSARSARIIKLNDEELLTLSRLFEVDSADASGGREMVQRFYDWGADTVVVTRGAKGCSVYSPEGDCDVASEPVTVVDAVGAGDAFTAAFIIGRLRDWPRKRCAAFANRVGGIVAGSAGAMPEIAEQAQALLRAME